LRLFANVMCSSRRRTDCPFFIFLYVTLYRFNEY
jgi:hypothetical protein